MDGSARMDKNDRAARLLAICPAIRCPMIASNLFRKSRVKSKAYQPALSYDEWNELKTMCAQDRDVKSGWGFDIG